jgi:hypothetical protein
MPLWWRRRSVLQRVGIAGAGVLVCVPIVIAGALSGSKDSSGGKQAATSPSPTTSTRTTTPTALSAPDAPSLAPAAARHKAAAICRSANAYYQTEFNDGVTLILNRPAAGSSPVFSAWYKKAENGDQQRWKNASAEVDGYFTAADKPSSVRDWYDDNGLLSADLDILAYEGRDAGSPRDAATRQAIQEAVGEFREHFADAQKDADRIEAGT